MKFVSFVVAAAVAISTIAALEPCDITTYTTLLPIVGSDRALQCQSETGFDIMMACLQEAPPSPEQYTAICASLSCKSALDEFYGALPKDCALSNGDSLKAVIDPLYKACDLAHL